MKNKILEIIKSKPCHYIFEIIKDNELLDWININSSIDTTNLSEKIYSALTNDSDRCKYDQKRKFKSVSRGYGYCEKFCQCHRDHVADRKNWSEEKKQKIASKSKNTSIKKYGSDYAVKRAEKTKTKYFNKSEEERQDLIDKSKNTMTDRYGKNYGQVIHQKAVRTNIEKYGFETNLHNPDFRIKTKEIMSQKYGGHSSQNIETQNKIKLTMFGEEKFKILENEENFCNFISGKPIIDIVTELKSDYKTIISRIERWNCINLINQKCKSSQELKIRTFLETNNINFLLNNRKIIAPLELDFYLEEYKIAIETSGLYYHSELSGGKIKDYHYNKWKRCQDLGIDLYTWWDIDVNNKWNIITSKILYLTKTKKPIIMGARKLKIREINFTQESEFLTLNHIQGPVQNRNLCYGAFSGDKLLALISIRRHTSILWEIVRFAVDLNYSIPGGFTRLLAHAIKTMAFNGQITSISDNCHSNGGLYKACGFNAVNYQKSAYFYTKSYQEKLSRQAFMKDKIKTKFNLNEDYVKSKTEWELMQELGYDRIWDSGKIKWAAQSLRFIP